MKRKDLKMKAIVATKYGGPEVLQLKEVQKPTPKDNEILIKVHATTVTAGDFRMRSFTVPPVFWIPARLTLGLTKPKQPIYGMELAGEVEAVGSNVTRFKPGDAVFASTMEVNFGGYAEYKCFPETGVLAIKPANLNFGEAAAAWGGAATALRCLQHGNLQAGQSILIYGASGAVGTSAVQLAHNLFGAEVTAVCSTANLELVRMLGANRTIDYTREDFTRQPEHYDVVFDAVARFPEDRARLSLKSDGIYLNVHRDANSGRNDTPLKELHRLKELLEAGVYKPVIDRVYPLEQIVEAHRYVEAGHKRGNVVITIQ
jgi:NADPH:quinone reductase-like Zn-dependent oxidoreductase